MKKKLELKKETVAMLDGMNEVRGGGTVLVSYQSNCNLCPTDNNACWLTKTPACDPEPEKSNKCYSEIMVCQVNPSKEIGLCKPIESLIAGCSAVCLANTVQC